MISIDIRGLAEVQSKLRDLSERQIPYATMVALNRTQYGLTMASKALIQKTFDRPTPRIIKATRYEKATKTNLVTKVFFSDDRLGLLLTHELGGSRHRIGFERKVGLPEDWFAVPTKNMKLNQYGNPDPATKRKIVIAKSLGQRGRRQFLFIMPWESGFSTLSGRISPGIYETKTGSMELTKLFHFIKMVEYKPIFNWEKTMKDTANKLLPVEIDKAIEQAIRTAK